MKKQKESWLVYYLAIIVISMATVGFIYLAYSVEATTNMADKPQQAEYTTQDTVYRLLRKYQGVSYELVDNIITCESGYRSYIKNGHSTASGYFQILFGTWYEGLERLGWSNLTSPFDGERNLEMGIYYLSIGQEWRWNASKHCWSR